MKAITPASFDRSYEYEDYKKQVKKEAKASRHNRRNKRDFWNESE